MKLWEALDKICAIESDEAILAKKPWNFDSDALITSLDEDYRVPGSAADQGYVYFIDAPVANEVVGVLDGKNCTLHDRRNLLFYYAVNDAYPSWVYDL